MYRSRHHGRSLLAGRNRRYCPVARLGLRSRQAGQPAKSAGDRFHASRRTDPWGRDFSPPDCPKFGQRRQRRYGPQFAEFPVMRRLRRLPPGAWWFVTVRCLRAEYRLRPDPVRRNLLGYCLAKAAAACPGIQLAAFVQMSNHLHLVLKDENSELSDFMCRFTGRLGRMLNSIDTTRGPVFERRYSSIQILDSEAVLERIRYTVENPVNAELVARPHHWPGLLMWPGGTNHARFEITRLQHGRIHKDCEEIRLRIPDFWPSQGDTDTIVEESRAHSSPGPVPEKIPREAAKFERMDPFGAPLRPKRSPMPLCHTSSLRLWIQFAQSWRLFVDHYRRASLEFRLGNWGTSFPAHCFRPWVPIGSSA